MKKYYVLRKRCENQFVKFKECKEVKQRKIQEVNDNNIKQCQKMCGLHDDSFGV